MPGHVHRLERRPGLIEQRRRLGEVSMRKRNLGLAKLIVGKLMR